MNTQTRFIIGTAVTCADGPCGDLRRVVIDPIARAVTHLVVEPHHYGGAGRLVPITYVTSTDRSIQLSCTEAEFHAMEEAEEMRFLAGGASVGDYGDEEMMSWAYYPLGMSMGMPGSSGMGASHVVVSDRIPVGEVEVRRGERVHATDGDIGRVQGLVVDPADHHVTHVLLDEGHLWRQKRVAIPIGAVTDVTDGVSLRLSKHQVEELPEIELGE